MLQDGRNILDNEMNRKEVVKNSSFVDGLSFFVAVGPAFLWREGVVYGYNPKYLSVVHNRAWSAKEAEIYPSA